YLLPPLSHRRRIFSAEIPTEQRTVPNFHPHLLPAMATASHFLLRPGSVILRLAVVQATGKPGWAAAFQRLVTEKGFGWSVAAVAAYLALSVESVCSFGAGMGKWRAVVAISCFLTPQSFF